MSFKFFAIPKAVYFYCILPCLLIIIACLIFRIIYSRKKDTYYYTFNVNYFLLIAGIIISAFLPLDKRWVGIIIKANAHLQEAVPCIKI